MLGDAASGGGGAGGLLLLEGTNEVVLPRQAGVCPGWAGAEPEPHHWQ
jgi:hypothetical protein